MEVIAPRWGTRKEEAKRFPKAAVVLLMHQPLIPAMGGNSTAGDGLFT
jgi:hypothetical protein